MRSKYIKCSLFKSERLTPQLPARHCLHPALQTRSWLTCYTWRYCPFAIACLMMGVTDSGLMPRSLQYLVLSQTESCFCPLLALQPQQHKAIFSLEIIFASLIMCSQLAADFLETLTGVNLLSQKTQTLSLSSTSFSSQSGMFQLFAIIHFKLLRITDVYEDPSICFWGLISTWLQESIGIVFTRYILNLGMRWY